MEFQIGKSENFGYGLVLAEGKGDAPSIAPSLQEHLMRQTCWPEEVDCFWENVMAFYWTLEDYQAAYKRKVRTIRLPFHYKNAYLLKNHVEYAKKTGIKLIPCMHAVPGSQNTMVHSDYMGSMDFWGSRDNIKQFIALWVGIVERYKDSGVIAGYELMNEPEAPNYFRLINIYQETIDAIRRVDPNTPIILDGDNAAQSASSLYSVYKNNDHIIPSFHCYSRTKADAIQMMKLWKSNFRDCYCGEYSDPEFTPLLEEAGIAHSFWGVPALTHKWNTFCGDIWDAVMAGDKLFSEIEESAPPQYARIKNQIDWFNTRESLSLIAEAYPQWKQEIAELSVTITGLKNKHFYLELGKAINKMSNEQIKRLTESMRER